MIDVVVDQGPLGLADGFFDGVKLLGQVEARAPFVEHRDDPAQMAFSPLQPLDDIRMGLVGVAA